MSKYGAGDSGSIDNGSLDTTGGREIEQTMLRNATAELLAEGTLIEHYRDTGDEARAEVERISGLLSDANVEMERLFFVAADALSRENEAKAGREVEQTMIRNAVGQLAALTDERDEALAHVADARRIIEAVLRLCDTWDRSSDSNVAYAIRETMAIAGSGTRPTGDCGCDRHNSNHSHCYAGCDLSGCRMLGARP